MRLSETLNLKLEDIDIEGITASGFVRNFRMYLNKAGITKQITAH